MAKPANGGTTSLPQKLPGHSSVTWITLYFVQKGLAILSLSSKSMCLWLLRMCVCACTCTCVPTCPRFHLASLGRRCLLSGCCEPGMLVSSVVCLLTLLRGPLSVLLRPQFATSSSVWCLRFCVFSPSVHFCLRPSVCPGSHHALWVLWVSHRAQPAPGTGSFLTPRRPFSSPLTLPVSSHGAIFSSQYCESVPRPPRGIVLIPSRTPRHGGQRTDDSSFCQ